MINLSAIGSQDSVFSQMEQGSLTQLKNQAESGKTKTDEELEAVAHQFEAIFVHQLLKSMRSTVQKSGLFDSHATKMYESLYDQELANLMTEKRSIGLAEMIYKDLARLEEKVRNGQSENNTPVQELNPSVNFAG